MNNKRIGECFPSIAVVVVTCVLLGAAILSLVKNRGRLGNDDDNPRPPRNICVNNLRQIGVAFRQWAIDHDGLFPFQTSTNAGGTLEFSTLDNDGYDGSSALHLRVLSNDLYTPKILVCPEDLLRKPEREFGNVRAANVTYRVRSGANVTASNSSEVLAVCPIHGNALYCDGTVKTKKSA